VYYTVCDGFSHIEPAFTAFLWKVQRDMAMMAEATRTAAALSLMQSDVELAGVVLGRL